MPYRTALITGSSSGIGRALALRLARDATEVILCARREEDLASAVAEIQSHGGKARAVVVDVGNTDAIASAVRKADQELGGLDLVIANAGLGSGVRASDPRFTWESIANVSAVNFNGAIATLTAALPEMVKRGRGHVVAMSSLAAMKALPGAAAYCASKAGLSMFVECLRMDLVGTNVHATTIHPGFVRTAMTDRTKHSKPFMVECDAAVEHIVHALPSHPATIDFPFPLVAGMRIARAIPQPLWLRIAGRRIAE